MKPRDVKTGASRCVLDTEQALAVASVDTGSRKLAAGRSVAEARLTPTTRPSNLSPWRAVKPPVTTTHEDFTRAVGNEALFRPRVRVRVSRLCSSRSPACRSSTAIGSRVWALVVSGLFLGRRGVPAGVAVSPLNRGVVQVRQTAAPGWSAPSCSERRTSLCWTPTGWLLRLDGERTLSRLRCGGA
ncbi:MAG: hypothetical protein MZV64_44230 [Ignavibacteriales bacterium]|nr:hypothetical protein [Ignavibacteriales bacterium]